jgi:hypothetical protein
MPPSTAKDDYYPRILAFSEDFIISPDAQDYGHDKTRVFEILSLC